MLVRFQQDVVHLRPAAVVILAGTNDIAGNTGPTTQRMVEDNYTSMANIAAQNGIKVIFASITPAAAYPWKPGINPVPRIQGLNKWLQDFCSHNGYVYLNYYSSMADTNGGMLPGLSSDGVHPTAKGYSVMAPLADHAIAQALGR
jgi:lysophospholipase L1-like esterase